MTANGSDIAVPTPRRVAVIGGGITGLAAAQRLASRSDAVHVVLLEGSRRLGGIIRTEAADGFLMELGPDSFITNKPGAGPAVLRNRVHGSVDTHRFRISPLPRASKGKAGSGPGRIPADGTDEAMDDSDDSDSVVHRQAPFTE